ncbi:MAG: putative zinc protease AlbF [Syntrophorhabdus sp. PtaU1.Bin153]|nr:MAG: putative zinc protease AlbF [Syntrophorhabdus sp. PtaU1.Bin153]
MSKHFTKEERPSKRGPLPFFSKVFLFLTLFVSLSTFGKVCAMDVFTVENRLPVIFETRKDTGVVAAQVWVKVGSKYEDPRIAGITHFIEHLIFKGTEKVKANEMASRIEALGGSINAFTSYDNTVYHIVIPKNAFEEGLALLLDAVKNPAFPEAEIVKEKQVVLEEIKMGEDDPQRKLFKELFSVSYDGHPYGRPIIGFEETVRNVSPEDIRMYFREHYTPDNMAIVITGDFDREKARKILTTYARGYDDQKAKPFVVSRRKEEGSEKAKVVERNVRESYIAISYPVPPMTDDDTPSLEVLAKILGEGDSSRLQEQLKFKKGIVTNISTYLFSPKEEGLFIIIATFKGRTFDGITKAIDDEIVRLAKDGPTSLEIEKAKNMIRASYIYGAETAQGRARQIGNYQTLTGDPRYADHYLKALDRVGANDVTQVLTKHITAKEKKLAALLPNNTSNPHTYKLKNGLTYVVNNNKASPSFSFRLGFVGGLKEEPHGKNGTFNVLSRMLLKGTKTKDAAAIAREIDRLAGDISPYSGRNIFGLSGKFLSKDMKAAFTLLHELVTSATMKAADLEKVKGDVLSGIRQRDDDPIGSTFRKFNEVLYEGHPYSRDPMGTEGDIRNMVVKDVEDSYREYVSPVNAVLAVSGDLDEGELRKLLDDLFAKWQGPANALGKTPVAPRKQEVGVDREMMQSHLVFGFLGPGLLEEDRYAVEVLDAILSGMGGRIHKVLREENPYAYAVTFFNQMAYEVGGMGIYIGTDRKLVKEVEGVSKAEIERIIREGFTDREVEDGKTYLIGNHYISMQSNSSISTSMCLDTMYGLKPNYFKVWPGHIEKVTKEDVNRVAKKYLSLDKMVYVRVGGKE